MQARSYEASSQASSSLAVSERTGLSRGLGSSSSQQRYGTEEDITLGGYEMSPPSDRWTVVNTPSLAPKANGAGLHLPRKPDGDEQDVEFHDWVEDSKWSFIDHDRAIREFHGTLRESWYKCQGWVAVIIIGILVGTIGAMVHISTLWAHGLTRGICVGRWYLSPIHCDMNKSHFTHYPELFGFSLQDDPISYNRVSSVCYITVSCLLTCSAAWVVCNVSRQAAGAGVPEIKAILGGAEVKGFSTVKTGVTKWVALVGAVGGSLSIGKAAPLMHIAFNVGATVAGCFEKYRNSMGKMREMLTAATAAGVCVAFGAPLGGVLYAFEETSTFFSPQTLYRSFLCSVIAGATLQAWDPFLHGKLALFSINYHVKWNLWELPLFAMLGVLGGVIGYAFNSLHLRVAKFRKLHRNDIGPIKEVLIVTLLTTVLEIVFLPSGFHRTDAESLQMLFSHCDIGNTPVTQADLVHCKMTPDGALTLGVLKFFLTALSFGMLVPAGLFMPNLVIGACLGWYCGLLFDNAVAMNPFGFESFAICELNDSSCLVPAVYSIVGAAAVMGGVNRMTLSLVTIMFELTGGFEYIIPVTLGVMFSKWTSEMLGGKNSIYNLLMDHKGLPFLDPRFEGRHDRTSNAPISSFVKLDPSSVHVLYERQTIADTLEVLKASTPGFAVVKNDLEMKVLGYISKRQLTIALEELDEELQRVGSVAQGDIPVMFIPSSELSPETPFTFRQRTPSFHRQSMGGSSINYAYDLHGYVDTSPVTIRPECEVARVALLFRRLGLNSILVTDDNNNLQGFVTKKMLIEHLQRDYEMQERGVLSCPAGVYERDGPRNAMEVSVHDLPKGGFHQSEQEAEVHTGFAYESLPALPQGAQLIRKKTRRRSSRY